MSSTADAAVAGTPIRRLAPRGKRPGALTKTKFFFGLAPAAIVLMATILYPLAHSLWLTLESWNLLTNEVRWVGLGNWANLITDPALRQALWVTLVYSGGGVLLQTLIGLALALVLRKAIRVHLPGMNVFRVLVLATIVIAPLIWAFYFRSFFSPSFGLFNQVLTAVGLPAQLWANAASSSLASLIIADTWQWTPFLGTLLLAALLALPSEVLEAAALDGAGWFRSLVHVELPIIRNLVVVIVLLRLIDSVKYIELMYTITQGGPGTSTQTLNFYAFQTGFVQFQMGRSAAIAYVVFGVIMVTTLALIRFTRRSER
jgi:multiple sugar transport system permease protein